MCTNLLGRKDFIKDPQQSSSCGGDSANQSPLGMLTRQGGPGSVRFGCCVWNGSSVSGFRPPLVSVGMGGFSVFQHITERTVPVQCLKKTDPAVAVLRSVPGKTVPTVPVSGFRFGSSPP